MNQKPTPAELRRLKQLAAPMTDAQQAAAIDALLDTTSALFALLDACSCGATLEIQGRSLLPGNTDPIRASLTSETGARFVDVQGDDIQSVVCSLVKAWNR